MCVFPVPGILQPCFHLPSIYICPGNYNLIAGTQRVSVSRLTLTVSRKSSRHSTGDSLDDSSDNRIGDVESSTSHRKHPVAIRVRYDKESRKVRQQVNDCCVELFSIYVTFCYRADT